MKFVYCYRSRKIVIKSAFYGYNRYSLATVEPLVVYRSSQIAEIDKSCHFVDGMMVLFVQGGEIVAQGVFNETGEMIDVELLHDTMTIRSYR